MGKLRFGTNTTTLELITEFKDSVLDLIDKIEERYDFGKKAKLPERLQAAHTRKIILKWFFDNGGL